VGQDFLPMRARFDFLRAPDAESQSGNRTLLGIHRTKPHWPSCSMHWAVIVRGILTIYRFTAVRLTGPLLPMRKELALFVVWKLTLSSRSFTEHPLPQSVRETHWLQCWLSFSQPLPLDSGDLQESSMKMVQYTPVRVNGEVIKIHSPGQ